MEVELKKKNNKKISLVIGILLALIVTVGISYGLYKYSKTTDNQQLVAGDIYMKYTKGKEIVLNNLTPRDTYDEENYFEFTIEGKNDYSKDIWYDIVLSYGEDNVGGRTERIKDNLLKFRLVEIKDGEEQTVIDNQTYNDLKDKRIYVNTIKANTNEDILITYRLYMWVTGDSIITGNVDEAIYDMDTWNNQVFASINVTVNGDFNEKEILPDPVLAIDEIKETLGQEGGIIGVTNDNQLVTKDNGNIREWRYSGKTVNNYVYFNCKDNMPQNADNCEKWRIIGVFNDNGEEKIKIMRNSILNVADLFPSEYEANGTTYNIKATSASTAFYNKKVSGTNNNDWTTSGIMNWLNSNGNGGGYLNTLSDTSYDMIADATYYLGNIVYRTDTPNLAFEHERDSNNIFSSNQATWRGKIGLLYPSDIGYAVNDSEIWNSTVLYSYDGSGPKGKSWMYQTANLKDEFFISPTNSSTTETVINKSDGYINYNSVTKGSGVRPVLYLGSNINIKSGLGTTDEPYQLEGKAISSDVLVIDKPTNSICIERKYNGKSQDLVKNNKEGYTLENYQQTNAGSYEIKAKLKDDYRWSDKSQEDITINCSIEKASITLKWNVESYTYNGSEQGPTASVPTGAASGENLTITTTKQINAEENITSTATITEVIGGQQNKDNYTISNPTQTYSIAKATPTLTLSESSGNVFVDLTKEFTASAKLNNNDVNGTYTAKSDETSIAIVSVSGNTITITGKGTGTTNITVGFNPTDTTNYNSATSQTYSVTSKVPTASGVVKSTVVSNVTDTCTEPGFNGGLVAINTNGTLYQENSDQEIREYRYVGPDVDNYIYFNCQDGKEQNGENCEVWRILGIFKDEAGEEHLKIVRNNILTRDMFPETFEANGTTYNIQYTSSGDYAYWNYNKTLGYNSPNDWTTGGLQYWLNAGSDKETNQPSDGYMSYLSKNAKSMIENTKYYLGNFKYSNSSFNYDTPISGYTHERGSTSCNGSCSGGDIWEGNQAEWSGDIALMYPSDVRYAANSCSWSSTFAEANSNLKVYWLQTIANHSANEWLLSPSSGYSDRAAYWRDDGFVNDSRVSYNYGIRPTVNLISQVKIISGSGTSEEPYQLEAGNVSSQAQQSAGDRPEIVDENVGTNKTAILGSCNNLVYNGEEQTLVSGGKNVTYSNNKGTDAGTYTVTATTKNGYFFNDGSTSKTLSCTIEKKAVTINYSNTNVKYTGGLVAPKATAIGVNGEEIELETTKNKEVGNYTTVATMKSVNPNYTLRNTVIDYKITKDDVKEEVSDIKTKVVINYYLMNKDGINYTLVNSKEIDSKIGDSITGEVLNYKEYESPKEITIKLSYGQF